MVRIAVLDDYAGVAGGADWDSITGAEVVFFHDHVTDPDALVERLRDFDVVQMVRERTPLPQSVLEALPRLRLLSGTGRRQPHVDIETADRLGIPVTGTGGPSDPFASSIGGDSTLELTWGLILALTPPYLVGGPADPGGAMADAVGNRPGRQDARHPGHGPHRDEDGRGRPSLRHARERMGPNADG